MTTTMAKAPTIGRETRKFTVEEYFRMVDAGVLKPEEKVELMEGEILLMAPTGHRHVAGVIRYTRVLINLAANRFSVLIQSTLPLNERSAPEPDLALLKFRDDDYAAGYAGPEDTLLIIEVADSSLNYDRDVKAHIYGRAGIPETWVLNLPGDCIERFTEPGPEGYGEHAVLRRGGKIAPVSLPDVELAVEDLLLPAVAEAEEQG